MKRHEMVCVCVCVREHGDEGVLSLECTERVLLHLCVEGDLELMANEQELV